MIPTKITVIPIHPATHVRTTRGEYWIVKADEGYLQKLDTKRLLDKGKQGGLVRRKRQLEKAQAHKEDIMFWVAATGFKMPVGYFALWFYVPMPASWRPAKREAMKYKEHQNMPDIDNFIKKTFDGVMPRRNRIAKHRGADDRKIHCYTTFKVWVEWEEACIKLVEYSPEEYMKEFEHGHPSYGFTK